MRNTINGIKPKLTIKDSVFTNLFRDKKYLLQLYNALHPDDCSVTEDDIKDVTLEHVLVDANYNDLGFSVGDRLLILVESQSTWSLNIIVRALMYLAQTYHEFFKRTKQNLYGSKPVDMPKPELYVIFTGERPENPPDIISLSKDFFHGERIAIDAEVKILYQENEDNIIGQYVIFCRVYDKQRKIYGQTKKAILETIRICKDRNVLKEYLKEKKLEVIGIMATLFSQEDVLEIYIEEQVAERVARAKEQAEAYAKEMAEAYAKEMAEAYAKEREDERAYREAKETAARMIRKGNLSFEEISEFVPSLSLNDIKQIAMEITPSAQQ